MSARLAILFCLLAAHPLPAQDVKLAWDPNTEADLAGYRVYWGASSRFYTNVPPVSPVSPAPLFTVTGLAPGTWYFAVTAFNAAGQESDYSNEVVATIGASLKGDLNGDGAVNVLDLQLMINCILGRAPVAGSDLNGDGRTDVLDLQLLVNLILGVRK